MKRILLSIPLLLSPYTMVIAASCFLSFIIISDLSSAEIPLISAAAQVLYTSIGGIISKTIAPILPYLVIILPILSTILVIANIIYLIRQPMTAYEAALYNSELKRYYLPTHLINSIIATFGILLSVWGIPFFLIAILISGSAVFFTGITAAVCIIKIRKQKAITLTEAILYTTGSFILLIDYVAAGNLLYQIQRQTFGY